MKEVSALETAWKMYWCWMDGFAFDKKILFALIGQYASRECEIDLRLLMWGSWVGSGVEKKEKGDDADMCTFKTVVSVGGNGGLKCKVWRVDVRQERLKWDRLLFLELNLLEKSILLHCWSVNLTPRRNCQSWAIQLEIENYKDYQTRKKKHLLSTSLILFHKWI